MKIIDSILDTDLYKLTMQYAILKKFPDAYVKYRLIFRRTPQMGSGMTISLEDSLHTLSENCGLTNHEYKWMEEKFPYLPRWYLDFLGGYIFNVEDEVKIGWRSNTLTVDIEGPWYRTVLWDVPILAIVSELNYKFHEAFIYDAFPVIDRTQKKCEMFKERGLKIVEMGTRRRYSKFNQDVIVKTMKKWGGDSFLGTSNVALAYKYDLSCFGSVAHEWYSAHGAMHGHTPTWGFSLKDGKNMYKGSMANRRAVLNWKEVYGDRLDVGLTDTFTSEVFFIGDLPYNRALRQDSGDPIEWGNLYMSYCKALGYDIKSRHIIFSDSLNKEKIIAIDDAFKDKLDYSFGIGTWLTNDVPDITPLNMVIKLVEFNGEPCVKLGDGVGKETGDPGEIIRVKKELGII